MARVYGKVTLKGGAWRIEAEPHVIIRIKRVLQRISKSEYGSVSLTDTSENCAELAWFLERYPMEVEQADHLYGRAEKHRKGEERAQLIIDGSYTARAFSLAIPPRDYQSQAAELALQRGSLLLGDDLGIGKTCSAICVISDPAARPALVVTATHLTRQWENELHRFAPGLHVHVIKKGQPYDLLARRRGDTTSTLPGMNAFPDVLIITYSKLSGWADVLRGKVRSCIFDEGQELRHNDSAKYNAAEHIAGGAAIKIALTATPIYNYGAEIHNVLNVIAPGALGTLDEFTREWCGSYGDSRKMIKDPRAFGTYMREQALMLRRRRADVGRELPPVQIIPHVVDADEKPLDDIKTAATELAKIILSQGGQERGAQFRAAEELSNRLRQATGIAKARYVAAFVRMLVEQDGPVLLFGWHRAVYDIWMDLLKDLNPVLYTGSESPLQKAQAASDFLTGKSKAMIMSLRSGLGLDGLQKVCRNAVFGELDWSPGVHEQCVGRLLRDDLLGQIAAYYLYAETGSDPTIMDVLNVKKQQVEGIRDPNGDLVTRLETDPERIRKLASSWLERMAA
jgi:hypothetical protein